MVKRRSLILGVMAGFVLPLPAFATPLAQLGGLEVTEGYLRASPASMPTGVGYVTIRSTGPADRLIGFTTPACTRPELHTHENDNGIMRMRKVEAIEVPAGGEARLQSGGLHLMLIDLVGPLRAGENVPLTLIFEHAGAVELTLPVKALGAMN